MPIDKLKIKSKIKDYTTIFCASSEFISVLKQKTNTLFIIDSNVWKYHAKGCLNKVMDDKSAPIILPISEERKSLDTVEELYSELMRLSFKRNGTIIAIGGGIVQDIVGFVASTLYRGVDWIFIPTTLLSQSDSCIGGKTSLNYKNYKNLIGTFYPPSQIYIYTPFLKTQAEIDFFSGVGEVAKLHLIGGEEKMHEFMQLWPDIIEKKEEALLKSVQNSLLVKKSYIEEDELDLGIRNILNFGHCFGHALESATKYAIPHGQAVVLGMLLANYISMKRNLMDPNFEKLLKEKILLPIVKANLIRLSFNDEDIINAMKQDKKRTGVGLPIVIMKDGFKMEKKDDLTEKEVLDALNELNKIKN